MKRGLILLSILLVFHLPLIAQSKDSLAAPIIFQNDTIFYIHNGFEGVSIDERARIINSRLEAITTIPNLNGDSLKLIDNKNVSRIYYGNRLVLMVNDQDAQKANTKRETLALEYFETLKSSLVDESNEQVSLRTLSIQALEVIGVITIVIFLIWVTQRLLKYLQLHLLKYSAKRLARFQQLKGLKKNYAERVLPLISSVMKVFRFILLVTIIYISLPVIFYIFPWTEPIGDKLISYVLIPLRQILSAIIRYIPNLLTILVIYLVTRYILKVIQFFAEEISTGTIKIEYFYPDWALPTFNIIRFLAYAFMFIIIFPYLPGSESKVFQGVTVFLGVLLSLGSTSAIANIVSGVILTYMRPFKIGDRVQIGEVIGDVISKNLLVTKIRTIKNEDITVPNSSLLSNHSINYSSSANDLGLILYTTITLTYDTPWRQVNQLMIAAALKTNGILKEPTPFVLQTALNDFYVSYQINAFTNLPQQMVDTYSELHKNLQEEFNEAGVEIMSPHVYAVRDGNCIQIPDQYKPDGYKSPGFKVDKTKDE